MDPHTLQPFHDRRLESRLAHGLFQGFDIGLAPHDRCVVGEIDIG